MPWNPNGPELIAPQGVRAWGAAPIKSKAGGPVTGWFGINIIQMLSDGTLSIQAFSKMLVANNFAGVGTLGLNPKQIEQVLLHFAGIGTLDIANDGGNRPPLDGLSIWTASRLLAQWLQSGQGSLAISTKILFAKGIPLSGNGLLNIMAVAPALAGMALGGNGALAIGTNFPTFAAAAAQFTANGTYTIPWWCNKIDVIALGAGGGGTGGVGAFTAGNGGGQNTSVAQFGTYTLTRGVDIPWSTSSLSVTVGAGGAGSPGAVSAIDIRSPSPGGQSGVMGTGLAFIGGAGGEGGTTQVGFTNRTGLGPGNKVYNGITYTGGANTTSATAQVPGSGGWGGAGGLVSGSAGNTGGRGQVWLRAYQ